MPLRAFSIIELMVVVGILGVLLLIALPALSSMNESAMSAISQSNLKQWGRGSIAYSYDHDARVPWEGPERENYRFAFSNQDWYINAVPPYLDLPSYAKIDDTESHPLPPSDESLFIDPKAELPDTGEALPFEAGEEPNGKSRRFFFTYAMNSQLNGWADRWSDLDNHPRWDQDAKTPWDPTATAKDREQWIKARQISMSDIPKAGTTILMMELRTTKSELPQDEIWVTDQILNQSLDRSNGDWRSFARRYGNGSHVVMTDGSVRHLPSAAALKSNDGQYGEDTSQDWEAVRDWNSVDHIWNPLGKATWSAPKDLNNVPPRIDGLE